MRPCAALLLFRALALSASRVRLQIPAAHLAPSHMGIDLSAGKAGMPEELLHHSEIGAAIEHMGGKCVAKHVRMDPIAQASLRRIRLQEILDPAFGDPPAVSVQKQSLRLPPAL